MVIYANQLIFFCVAKEEILKEETVKEEMVTQEQWTRLLDQWVYLVLLQVCFSFCFNFFCARSFDLILLLLHIISKNTNLNGWISLYSIVQ